MSDLGQIMDRLDRWGEKMTELDKEVSVAFERAAADKEAAAADRRQLGARVARLESGHIEVGKDLARHKVVVAILAVVGGALVAAIVSVVIQ